MIIYQGKTKAAHAIVALVLITFAQVGIAKHKQWNTQELKLEESPKVIENSVLASAIDSQTVKETENVTTPQQVSKQYVNDVYHERTKRSYHSLVSKENIEPEWHARSKDQVFFESYQEGQEAPSFPSLSSQVKLGTNRPNASTNLHRLSAGQARLAHRVITAREGQQHIPTQGSDAASLARPYNHRATASVPKPYPHTHQHLSSLTSRQNTENLRPDALNGFIQHAISSMSNHHPGHILGRQQMMSKDLLHQNQHVGQSQITLTAIGRNSQPRVNHEYMNARKIPSYARLNSRLLLPADSKQSYRKEINYNEAPMLNFTDFMVKPETQSRIQQSRPERVIYINSNKTEARKVTGLDRSSAKESVKPPQISISFLRQAESLNPLSVRRPILSPSSGGKPGGLTSTSLANEHHRNVSHIDFSSLIDPHKSPSGQRPTTNVPSFDTGGPVNPAQLLLQTLDARPVAPGRPPSSVLAQPSPIVPESLIGSTEAPPATLSFVRNRTDQIGYESAPPSAIEPETLQISGAHGGQNLGPSPFFSGAPLRPDYVYTTQSPPRPPVDPASLLIASGLTTKPPITVPPPGYNPLLSSFQKLDIVHVNDNPIPSGVDIPAPQDTLAALENKFPWENPQLQNIPGEVPFEEPLLITSNDQGAETISNLFDNQDSDQISVLEDESPPTAIRTESQPFPLSPLIQQQQSHISPTAYHPQQLPTNRPVSNIPQLTNNGYYPQQNTIYPADHLQYNLFNHHNANPQIPNSEYDNFPLSYPNIHPGHLNFPPNYPNIPAASPDYPPHVNTRWPFGNQQYPAYGVPIHNGVPFPNSNRHPYPYPAIVEGQEITNKNKEPSASVGVSVTNKVSSAESEAEGGDGVVSSSTTIIKGGSSTSNNNFYRPRPGGGQGTSAVSLVGSSVPSEVSPVPVSTSSTRPMPPIIINGVRNETATPSDVFPESNVNVACSRRHGCPTFILRSRPKVSPPEDERKNTYIFDESVERRPSGNINIACDFQEGCPTYIINTTPDPQQVPTTTFAPPTIIPPAASPPPPSLDNPQPSQDSSSPQSTSPVNESEILEAINLVLGLLNKTETLDFVDDESLTGDFDYIFQAAGVEGFDNLLSHTPGLAPPINPQNIRPGLQIIPVPTTTTTLSPLAQHIGLQNRPNYEVVRVPENAVLNSPSLSNLLDNKRVFSVNPLLTRTPEGTIELTSDLLGQPGSYDILRNRLVQAHLEALQENGLGVTSPDPLGAHVAEVANLDDAHMGGVVSTERPSLASILNLEPQNIPNEPPLVEINTPEDDHHHGMMRHVMAATFMGLPMTTALMAALGAPVALMAPLGLAIPALLTMGFMDVNSNQGNFGHHFRRHLHGHGHHGHHQHRSSATTTSSPVTASSNDGNRGGASPTQAPSSTSSTQAPRTGGSRMSLGNGGGIAGAIRRLGGILPMMASRFATRMGRSTRRVRRRREAEEKFSVSDISEKENISSDSETPSLHLSHGDLETLRDMNRLYSSFSTANNTQVEKPSSEEVLLHRKYLLGLLKQLRNKHRFASSPASSSFNSGSDFGNTTSSLTKDKNATVVPDALKGTSESETDTEVSNSEAGELNNNHGNVNRIGQIAPENVDLQNIDAEAAALLLHQFQTQGSANLLPPSLLGHAPPTTPPPRQFDLLFGTQPAPAPLASSNNAARLPTLSNMDSHRQDLANSAGFQGNLPPSLLNVAVQNGGTVARPGGFDATTGEVLPPSVLLGDPSRFSDYVAVANALLNFDSATASPSVVMVDKLDFQEIGVADQLSSLPFNTSELNRLQFNTPVGATVQNTRLTTELTDAFTNLINNLGDALSQFITDLQAAIDANPAVALLLLLPLLLLPFLFQFHGGGYGHGGGGYGGGYGHRRVYYPSGARALLADTQTLKILEDIISFEKLFHLEDETLS